MDTGMLSLVKDYGDLAIGLVLLIAGVWVLPGRIKWYVLTAGLAVIGACVFSAVDEGQREGHVEAENSGQPPISVHMFFAKFARN